MNLTAAWIEKKETDLTAQAICSDHNGLEIIGTVAHENGFEWWRLDPGVEYLGAADRLEHACPDKTEGLDRTTSI